MPPIALRNTFPSASRPKKNVSRVALESGHVALTRLRLRCTREVDHL